MAQLRDTLIQGSARVTDTLYTTTLQVTKILAPTASNGTTFGPGTDGYVIKSNGTSVYWTAVGNSVSYNVTDRTAAAAIVNTGTGLMTERAVYYGLPTINNSHAYNSGTAIYAPSEGGTANTTALVGNGATTKPKWVNITPSISITAGTSTATPKINVTVLGQSGTTAQSLTTASTSAYGATKLTDSYTSTDSTLATTGKAILAAIQTLDVTSVGATAGTKYIAAISEADGKISATAVDVATTYSSTGTTAVSGKSIAAAIGTLDVTAITGTAAKTITSISETDGKISATYSDIAIGAGQVTSGTLTVARGGTGQSSIANIQAGKDGDGNTISTTYTKRSQAIPYIVGPSTDTTAGTWTGSDSTITAYADGLTIIYVPAVAGAATTTLNINGLGAKTCYFTNTSKLTTHFSVGTPIMFTYVGGTWKRADYNSDTNTQIRVYRQNTSTYNADFPLIASRTATIGTAGSNDTYTQVYGLVGDTNQPTINPTTGMMKVPGGITANITGTCTGVAWNNVTGKPSTFTPATHTHEYLPLSGGTLTGGLNLKGDLNLYTTSNDAPDIVWWYANGSSEKARIWIADAFTEAVGPYYRCYNSSGTALYNANLVIGTLLENPGAGYTTYAAYVNSSAPSVLKYTNQIAFNNGAILCSQALDSSFIAGSHSANFYVSTASTAAAGNAYDPWVGGKTYSGAWSMGVTSGSNDLKFIYGSDTNFNAQNNEVGIVTFGTGGQVYGAVWNDYAEYRKQYYDIEPGRVVYDLDDGHVMQTEKRLMPGAQVVSDTFGFAIGETKECKTPLAVSGRVLAYTHRNRYDYHAGDAVCSAPNGTVDIMTREEIINYPDCIIGIVSEIPEYEVWGERSVAVNNRIWIKVK